MHITPPAAAPDFNVGDKILVRASDDVDDWWHAVVVRKRSSEDGRPEVQYKWQGRKTARPDAWKLTTDPTVPAQTAITFS